MASQCGGEISAEGAASVCSDSTYQCSESSVDLSFDTGSECLEFENCEAAVEQQERLEREIVQLISQRAQMKSKISRTEDTVLGLETQLLDTKSQLRQLQQEETPLCQGCGQVRDPRHRKQLVLQGIYRDVLRDKPKQLLCIFGLFKRLEDMVDQGLFDMPIVSPETAYCCKCRQVSGCDEAKVLLLGDLAEVLVELTQEQGAHNTLECSTEGVCGECLAHVERCLNSEPPTSGPEPPPVENSVTESLPSGSADVQHEQGQADDNVGPSTQQLLAEKLEKLEELKKHVNRDIGVFSYEINQLKNQMVGANALDNKIDHQVADIKFLKKRVKSLEASAQQAKSVARTPLCLSEFSGEMWEDPNVALTQWERELRDCSVPESQWCLLVSKFLKGNARLWFDVLFNSNYDGNNTWKDYCDSFKFYFDNRECLHNYLPEVFSSKTPFPMTNPQLLQLALRTVGQNYTSVVCKMQYHFPYREFGGKLRTGNDFFRMMTGSQRNTTHNICRQILCLLLEDIYNDEHLWQFKQKVQSQR